MAFTDMCWGVGEILIPSSFAWLFNIRHLPRYDALMSVDGRLCWCDGSAIWRELEVVDKYSIKVLRLCKGNKKVSLYWKLWVFFDVGQR